MIFLNKDYQNSAFVWEEHSLYNKDDDIRRENLSRARNALNILHERYERALQLGESTVGVCCIAKIFAGAAEWLGQAETFGLFVRFCFFPFLSLASVFNEILQFLCLCVR